MVSFPEMTDKELEDKLVQIFIDTEEIKLMGEAVIIAKAILLKKGE